MKKKKKEEEKEEEVEKEESKGDIFTHLNNQYIGCWILHSPGFHMTTSRKNKKKKKKKKEKKNQKKISGLTNLNNQYFHPSRCNSSQHWLLADRDCLLVTNPSWRRYLSVGS